MSDTFYAPHSPNAKTVLFWLFPGGWNLTDSTTQSSHELDELGALANEPWLDIIALDYPLVEEGGVGFQPIVYIHQQIVNYINQYGYTDIAIGGYSAGAHLALLYSMQEYCLADKVISLAGLTDLNLYPASGGVADLINDYVNDSGYTRYTLSPKNYVTDTNYHQYLIVYNLQDTTVPVEQANTLFAAFEAQTPKVYCSKFPIDDPAGHLFFVQESGLTNPTTIGNIVYAIKMFLLTKPLHRYLRYVPNVDSDHYYTHRKLSNVGEWVYEIDEGRMLSWDTGAKGVVPLYSYWNLDGIDHRYTTVKNDTAYSQMGYSYDSIIGYIYDYHVPGTIPLHHWWNEQYKDSFYTTYNEDNMAEFYAAVGYTYEGIIGYVYPK